MNGFADTFGARFGALVKRRRQVEGLTQEALAAKTFPGGEGNKSRISELENGRTPNPHAKTIDALTVALNLTEAEIALCRNPGAGLLEEVRDHLREQRDILKEQQANVAEVLNATRNNRSLGADELDERLLRTQLPMLKRLEHLAQEVASSKGIPASPLRAILVKLGELGVPDWNIPARLDVAADELILLRGRLAEVDVSSPTMNAIRERALTALDAGDLDQAHEILEQGRRAKRGVRRRATLEEASLLADQAKIDHIQLSYESAAHRYSEAASLVSFDAAMQSRYFSAQAAELEFQGRELGQNAFFGAAIATYERALKLVPAETFPVEHAETMRNLGFAIANLGEREVSDERLNEAIRTYHGALAKISKKDHPLVWASIQHHLGSAEKALGERHADTAGSLAKSR